MVLGLVFDSTIVMPPSKFAKAQALVDHAFHTASLSSNDFRSILGYLRHVATCIHPAQAFLQRLRSVSERSIDVPMFA